MYHHLYLIEHDPDGIGSSGDPLPGFDGRSEFSIMAESIRLEAEHDAVNLGENPDSLHVRLDVANQIASLRLWLFVERYGLTQADAAISLGISRGHLNRLINGKAVISYEIYERLNLLETINALLIWIDRTKSSEQKDHFEALLSNVRIADPHAKLLYCIGAIFGETALQNFKDSTGCMTPIPDEADAPEALQAALRKVAV